MPSFQDFQWLPISTNGQEPLSVIDTAWLRMDRPTNLMMICGMMMFDERLTLEEVKEVLRTRLLCFHRFRQRVVERNGRQQWETDPYFDLDWHVRRIALPESGSGSRLEEVASDLISTPLDASKPMWQYHLIDHANGASTLLLRIHHCYGDGFALMHVMTSMTDLAPDKLHATGKDIPPPGPKRSAWEHIFGPVGETAGDALRTSLTVIGAGWNLLAHPFRAIDYAKAGTDLAYEAAFIANMAPDSPTCFKGLLGVMKRVALAKPLSLTEVKVLSGTLACSVNDVLVSCIAGALRRYLLDHGDLAAETEVRALVPVNLRPSGQITELGNRFGLVFLSLPIGMDDPVERALEVHQRMAQLKNSQQPLVALGILAGMGVAPDFIKERVLESLAANASVVITNVHGSDQPRYFAGKSIASQMFWVPQSGGIGLGISILSYAGQVSFGIVTDAQRVPDPDAIAKYFSDEFEALLLSVLMMPWPGEAEPL
jgi:diacylglycerol O-acyltransferase / wax synthase